MDNTTSTTTSTSYTYTTPPKYQSEKGWECPRCGRINAPWVRQCDCSNNWSSPTINWTSSDKSSHDDWWKTYVTCGEADNILNNPNIYQVGGSDYWDDSEKTWTNVLKNVMNMKVNY